MVKTFQVGIYFSDRTLYEGQAVSLIVPAASGYLGVLAGHLPLIANLTSGKITIRTPQGVAKVIDSSPGGFMEVLRNQVTLLL